MHSYVYIYLCVYLHLHARTHAHVFFFLSIVILSFFPPFIMLLPTSLSAVEAAANAVQRITTYTRSWIYMYTRLLIYAYVYYIHINTLAMFYNIYVYTIYSLTVDTPRHNSAYATHIVYISSKCTTLTRNAVCVCMFCGTTKKWW